MIDDYNFREGKNGLVLIFFKGLCRGDTYISKTFNNFLTNLVVYQF